MDAYNQGARLLIYSDNYNLFFWYAFSEQLLTIAEVNNFTISMDNCRKVLSMGNSLFFISSYNCTIYKFTLDGNSLHFERSYNEPCFEGSVKNAYLYDDQIWIFPISSELSVAMFDIRSKNFVLCNTLKLLTGRKFKWREILQDGADVYLSSDYNDDIFKLNLSQKEGQCFHTGIGSKVDGIVKKGDLLFVRQIDGKKIYTWNISTKELKIIAESDIHFEQGKKLLITEKGKIIICPVFENSFYYVNEEKKTIERIVTDFEIEHCDTATLTIGSTKKENSLYIFPWASDFMLEIIDDDGVKIKHIPLVIKHEDYLKIMDEKIKEGTILQEEKGQDLDVYIEAL